eukprot:8053583-Alexandrium_andersonii.AAC.1
MPASQHSRPRRRVGPVEPKGRTRAAPRTRSRTPGPARPSQAVAVWAGEDHSSLSLRGKPGHHC